jgi:hypothetical protein
VHIPLEAPCSRMHSAASVSLRLPFLASGIKSVHCGDRGGGRASGRCPVRYGRLRSGLVRSAGVGIARYDRLGLESLGRLIRHMEVV